MCAQKCFLERVELRNTQPHLLALIILNKRLICFICTFDPESPLGYCKASCSIFKFLIVYC